jgi:adenosylmethionine-8-amino-7-oxononanoate aminotransferase
METHHIAPCYAYREQRTDETAETYALRAADELENKIVELGAENVIGFVAEPVVGATLGAVPPEPGYFRRIREICDRHGILLILDEVMCGMGRTGTLFACEQDEICGDLITIAKGLGGGYQPVGAVMVNEQIYQTIHQGTGFFQHGHTYLGHAVACAAALAVQRVIERENLLQRVRTMGTLLMDLLVTQFGEHPYVGDIRGRGLFVGLEFVADKSSKSPFEPSLEVHHRLKSAAMDNGLICYPMGGTVDGRQGSHVLLAPPYNVSENQLSDIVDRLAVSLDTTLKTLD